MLVDKYAEQGWCNWLVLLESAEHPLVDQNKINILQFKVDGCPAL